MGVASEWNLWVWLEYIGVVNGVVVRRYTVQNIVVYNAVKQVYNSRILMLYMDGHQEYTP